MRNRPRDPALDRIETWRRGISRVDAAEHDEPVATGDEDSGVIVAASEFHGESGNAGLHQPIEQRHFDEAEIEYAGKRFASQGRIRSGAGAGLGDGSPGTCALRAQY